MVGVFNSLDHTTPKNAGSFRRLRIHLREGCIVGIPRHPTSCSVATSNIADRVSNAVQSAIADIAEGIGMAECGAVIPASMSVISGIDPKTTRQFVNQVLLGFTAGAAAPATDAWQTIMHVGCAGMCFMDSIELDELRHPIYVYERRFVIDTEGPGRHRGAHSLLVEFGPAGCDIDAGYTTDGTINRAKGVRGGHDGSAARQYKVGRNGQVDVLPSCAQVRVLDGERIRTFSSGGAGYGSPLRRDPASVARDIKDRWIGAERARTVYGVILDASGNVDVEETRRLRAAMTS